ncbi:MAG TPA: ABC transporter substrate-binding protein [Thermoanaerobaculia bacterium]|nr:ABC transporter substrate-binding protein [Thermoanaerobaculia bacterium]
MPTTPFRRRLAALATTILFAALAACAGERAAPEGVVASDGGEPRSGGQVVIGSSSDLGGVNEVIVPLTSITNEVIRQLFLPLVDEMPDYRTLRPRLAESWTTSEDHRTLTFRLRHDVTWSDGVPVTAADVEFSYRAWTSPELAWEGAAALTAVEGVEVLDDRTVAFRFAHPYSTQLLDVAAGAVILPAHAWGRRPFADWRDDADWFRDNLVVNGPFTLASWAPQQEIVLERNPTYYEEGLPRLDRVTIRVVADQTAQLTQLLNGQLDFVIQLSPDDASKIEKAPGVELVSYWTRGYISIGWNVRSEPFSDPRVRRAMTLAIDRDTLVEAIWGDLARPIASPIPPDTWAWSEEVSPLPYAPDEARRLLAAAGWTDQDGDGVRDKEGRPFRFRLITNAGNRPREDALVLIQDQLRRVGVVAQPEAIEFHSLIEQVTSGRFDATVMGWGIPTTFDFRYAYHSAEIGSTNFTGFSEPEVDRLLEEARLQTELAAMGPYLDRLQVIQQELQPYTFLWQSKQLHGIRERVNDAAPNHLRALANLREWWVEE